MRPLNHPHGAAVARLPNVARDTAGAHPHGEPERAYTTPSASGPIKPVTGGGSVRIDIDQSTDPRAGQLVRIAGLQVVPSRQSPMLMRIKAAFGPLDSMRRPSENWNGRAT